MTARREAIDLSIRDYIGRGARDTDAIAKGVIQSLPPPIFARATYDRFRQWTILRGRVPSRAGEREYDYIGDRAHALLAERWAHAVVEGQDAEEDQPWSHALEHASTSIAPFLPRNPRRRKRVLNSLFLRFMLADMRGLLQVEDAGRDGVSGDTGSMGLSPAIVARWALLVAEWPRIASAAVRSAAPNDFMPFVPILELAGPSGLDDRHLARLRRLLEQEPSLDRYLAALATMSAQ